MKKRFGFICFKCHAWGDYNMNIRCNQKFMFCKDRGIDFSIWFIRKLLSQINILEHFRL